MLLESILIFVALSVFTFWAIDSTFENWRFYYPTLLLMLFFCCCIGKALVHIAIAQDYHGHMIGDSVIGGFGLGVLSALFERWLHRSRMRRAK